MSVELAAYAERAGVLAFFAALAFILARAFRVGPRLAGLLTLAVGVLLAIPYNGGLSTIDRFYSVSGATSAALFVLLAMAVLRSLPGFERKPAFDPVPLAGIILAAGVVYYWFELSGRTRVDPYTLGYANPFAPLVLAVVPFLFLRRGAGAIGAWLALGGVLFLAGAYQSRNLFDYLIDPVAVGVALVLVIDAWVGRRRATRLPGEGGERSP